MRGTCSEAGGLYLQLIGAGAKPGQTFTADQYKLQGEIFTEIGKRIADYGIKLGFHNHMNSIGQPPEAVDAILAASDPNYAYLLLDVAHYVQGGGDPVAAIHKYSKRILFMHFKDVKNADNPNGYEWVELGKGHVDFPGRDCRASRSSLPRLGRGGTRSRTEGRSADAQRGQRRQPALFREKLGVRA